MLMKHNFNTWPKLYCMASGVPVFESPEAQQTKSEREKLLCAIKGKQNNDLI